MWHSRTAFCAVLMVALLLLSFSFLQLWMTRPAAATVQPDCDCSAHTRACVSAGSGKPKSILEEGFIESDLPLSARSKLKTRIGPYLFRGYTKEEGERILDAVFDGSPELGFRKPRHLFLPLLKQVCKEQHALLAAGKPSRWWIYRKHHGIGFGNQLRGLFAVVQLSLMHGACFAVDYDLFHVVFDSPFDDMTIRYNDIKGKLLQSGLKETIIEPGRDRAMFPYPQDFPEGYVHVWHHGHTADEFIKGKEQTAVRLRDVFQVDRLSDLDMIRETMSFVIHRLQPKADADALRVWEKLTGSATRKYAIQIRTFKDTNRYRAIMKVVKDQPFWSAMKDMIERDLALQGLEPLGRKRAAGAGESPPCVAVVMSDEVTLHEYAEKWLGDLCVIRQVAKKQMEHTSSIRAKGNGGDDLPGPLVDFVNIGRADMVMTTGTTFGSYAAARVGMTKLLGHIRTFWLYEGNPAPMNTEGLLEVLPYHPGYTSAIDYR